MTALGVFISLVLPAPANHIPYVVQIKDCKNPNVLVPLYFDKERTMPMVNPMITDGNGQVGFWMKSGCYRVEVRRSYDRP